MQLTKNQLKRLFVTTLILCLGTFQEAFSQDIKVELPENNELTIDQVIKLSVVNNPEVKRAILSVENADEQVKLAWSEVLPDVTSSASFTRNIEIPVNFVPATFFDPNADPDELVPLQFGTDNNWQGGITVSQNIFRGEAIVGISSSSVFKSVQEEALRSTIQQIITQSRKGFHAVLIAEEQLRLQEATIERIEENLEENRSRYEAGLIEEYDVLRLEVQLANQQPQLKDAQLSVEEAYRNLKELMALPLDLPLEIVGSLSEYQINNPAEGGNENETIYNLVEATPLPMLNEGEALDVMRNKRGDLRVLEVQQSLKDREIRAIKSRFLPTVTADYNLQWTAAQPGTPRPFESAVRFQTLMVNVSVPIFTGFERMANLNIAQIEKRDLEVQEWAAEKTALNEYETTLERLRNLEETANARRQAVDQAQRGYEIAVNRYENGVGSQLEVTEAELQVREAELNYALSVADYLNSKADFDLAIGMVPMIDETEYEF
ncbi:TolC family protein [Rhodohalobacter sulfatireducens]|uniref:TolC family protein n=1 Tax=Rhodohalobacter sulfatireducens TaxID=2911366 RepID=A0ABS9KA22_9BACT|nr:TolC family protein [Rhodohalobacter sulfatireducens]MCG2587691.1 TolC family protein [Rhodohalobacter sulfatireducens]MDR9365526.1 TolC family protein [Balneolaceae bacterium]MDR9407672.1 TolC family protein [Balneolaceae bacterium]